MTGVAPLARLVGVWSTEATHPAMPGVVVHGTTVIEWLEGERFLIVRGRTDHPDFPDSISVVGDSAHDRVDEGARATDADDAGPLHMHYFDSRGVSRVYDTRIDDGGWHVWRDATGFSQRFTGTFTDGDDAIDGLWQMRKDDGHWADDLKITYTRSR